MKERSYSKIVTEVEANNYEDHDMILGRHKLVRSFKEMRDFWEQIQLPCIFRNIFILLSFSIFAVFQSSSATVSGLYHDLIMISNCSAVPLTHCPSAREVKAFREQCINGFERDVCVAGSTYLCGIVDGYLIETCAVDMECWPGTFFNFVIRNGTVTLECVRCPDGTFETEHTKTSQSSHVLGCSYRHIPPDDISSNLVLYENGTHATPSIYRCKTEEGFFDEYGNKFCDDIQTHRCKCIFKYCKAGHQLHPSGHCKRCRKKLRPEKDWRCEDYVSYQTTSSKTKSTISGALSSDSSARPSHFNSRASTNTSQTIIMVTDPTRNISPRSTDSIQTDSDKSTLIAGVLLGIVVTVAIVCLLVFFWLLKLKKRSKKVRDKDPISPAVTFQDKRVTNIDITNVYSYDGNVQLGDRSKMINMVSTPVKDGPPPNEEDIADAYETLQESIQLLQDSDSEDNDGNQTAKEIVI